MILSTFPTKQLSSLTRPFVLGVFAVLMLLSLDSCKTGKPSYSRAINKYDAQPNYYKPRTRRYALIIVPTNAPVLASVKAAK